MLVIISPREFKHIKRQLTRSREFVCKTPKLYEKTMVIVRHFPGLAQAKIIKSYENETSPAGTTNAGHIV